MKEMMMSWVQKIPAGGLGRLLWIAAAVLVLATGGKAMHYAATTWSLPTKIEETVKKNQLDDETVKKLLSQGKEKVQGLRKKSLFAPAAAKPNPPVCVGIFGPMAIIGDRGYLVGESVNGAKILRINPADVVIEWEGKEMTLIPFSVENASQQQGSRDQNRNQPPQGPGQPQPVSAPTVRVEGGEGRPSFGGPPTERMRFEPTPEMRQRMEEMRGRFENATPEERERMRQEFRQNRGDMGMGPGMRGG